MKLGGYHWANFPLCRAVLRRLRQTGQAGRELGFTVVETLIVLAVTGALFLAAVMLINGRQNRTQFMTGINGLQQQIQQIINETANGYYPRDTAFDCHKGASTPPTLGVRGAVGDFQGQNADCIFMGKVLQFGVKSTDPQTYAVLPIVGNRTDTTSTDTEASTLYGTTGAFPEAAVKGKNRNPLITGINTSAVLANGLTVTSMWYGTSTTNTIGAVGFISSLPSPSGTGVASGSQTLGLYRLAGSALQMDTVDVVDLVYPSSGSTPLVAASSVSICVASGTTNQSGLIVIGANDASATTGLAVSLTIKSGLTC